MNTVLCTSRNYLLYAEGPNVYLRSYRWEWSDVDRLLTAEASTALVGNAELITVVRPDTLVGHHLGNPSGGFIDRDQRFCVSFGQGIVIYHLEPPFDSFGTRLHWRHPSSKQWTEVGRSETDPWKVHWAGEVGIGIVAWVKERNSKSVYLVHAHGTGTQFLGEGGDEWPEYWTVDDDNPH